MTSKSRLAIELSRLKVFISPDEKNEQYTTESEIAADVLWTAYMNGDIKGRTVADLGAGTGILGIGCLMLGASKVHFIEISPEAIKALKENLANLDNYSVVAGDIDVFNDKVDTVIMNPPFGTRLQHADKKFLNKAFSLAENIYSLHKTSTSDYISLLGRKNMYQVSSIDYKFPLKKTHPHHKKNLHRIAVSAFVFKRFPAKNI